MPSQTLSRFHVTGLRGDTDINVVVRDNTLVLVGENGSGKTTLLRVMFAFLSGRWASLAQFTFDKIEVEIGGDVFSISHKDIVSGPSGFFEAELLVRLPPAQRRRIQELIDLDRYDEAFNVYEHSLSRYIPNPGRYRQENLFAEKGPGSSGDLKELRKQISSALNAQILYLPTYRRIERELGSILQGVDPDEMRRTRVIQRPPDDVDDYVELVEFGMADVKRAIERTLDNIREFARLGATRLTSSYLGDVVSQNYRTTDRNEIVHSSPDTIEAVLSRIDDAILSQANKSHLREIIVSAKETSNVPSEHEQIIYHYFAKLLQFQRELQSKENSIKSFCDLCTTYTSDKKFEYNSAEFTFTIRSNKNKNPIELADLSSGEKQIVSMFSHLYLASREKFFVIIDEPELSLSVPWQRRFLLDIWRGDFCGGLLAATHSPFVYDNELRTYTHALGEFVSSHSEIVFE